MLSPCVGHKRFAVLPIVVCLFVLASACAPAAAPTPVPPKPAPPTTAPAPAPAAAPKPAAPAPTAAAPKPAAPPAATAAPAAPKPAATTKVNFRYDWKPTSNDVPVLAAQNFGWFREEGLEVSTIVGSGSNDSMTLTGSGQHDMSIAGAASIITALPKEVPVFSVGMIHQTNPSGFIMLPDSGIKGPKDFEGRKVGIQPASVGFQLYQALLKKQNINRSRITEVPVTPSPEPLILKQIDAFPAFLTNEPFAVEQAIGKPPVTFYKKEYGVDVYGQALIANKNFAAKNPDVLRRFVKAYARGMQWALDNPEKAVDLIVSKYPELKRPFIAYEVPRMVKLWTAPDTDKNGLLYQDPAKWQAAVDLFRDTGYLKDAVKVESGFTSDFLPKRP